MLRAQTIYEKNQILNVETIMKIELDDIKTITETALTIKGSRRRITVPSEVVELLKLSNGDKLRWIVFKDGTIHMQKV